MTFYIVTGRYYGDYFKDKHDLDGCVAGHRSALEGKE